MYKCVIFDLDGTLFDTSPGIIKALRYVINREGLPPLDDEKLKSFVGPPLGLSFEKFYSCSEVDKTRYIREFRDYYQKNTITDFKEYEGIDDLLNFLKEHAVKMGVATHKREDLAQIVISAYSLGKSFSVIYGNDDKGSFTKCEIIKRCIMALEEEPEIALYIGDAESDSIGARGAGVDFLAVTYGFGFPRDYDGKKCGAVYTARSVNDITNFLKENTK